MEIDEKPKVMVIGSCMSNITAAMMVWKFNFEHTNSVHHNRSDAFIKYHILKSSEMVPLDELEALLVPKPEFEVEARNILRNQYAQTMGFFQLAEKQREGKTFFDDLDEVAYDVILLDNFMDVASRLVSWTAREEYAGRKLFLNLGFYENADALNPDFSHDEYLTPGQSAENWLFIYQWLRKKQPKARIYFLTYHDCTSLGARDRYDRIKTFHPLFVEMARGTDLRVLPPLNLRPSLTKGEIDWPHFQGYVYEALAGMIFLDYESDFFSGLKL